ncbi:MULTISPECIES: RodZ domain-containing protein [Cyanophyceae]|uniref:helix-turn-helix domain-containing protein n=1 Tax=Cyanophyceae TaxID=3028117 RepID=UPI00016DCBF5|nr:MULTISPECIES: RodZ domain-containing protein [Cyanophyceae]ACB00336.1 conserved hypothetical protein [Picosynechococcus sp. PCC 7002]SMH52099.1 protein RodZ, contains Xre-like HTH and DUF4115 domains [Picosynechococcus sp. OG1]SMQ82259.1 protein RodZ, contains Xre-like HTH and DUF4115 domains [Synechococcus sp. 7002]
MKETAIHSPIPQQEYLAQIGVQLQQQRLAKDWSLAFVSRKTNIRRALLENIEAGRLEQLPEPVYLQGLLRCYAECLGLDGTAIAQEFPQAETQNRWHIPRWSQFIYHFQLRPSHLYLAYLLIIVATVQSLGNIVRNQNPSLTPQLDPALLESTTPARQERNTAQTTALSPSVTAPIDPNNNGADVPESVVVDIRAQEMAWMRVEIDGQTAFEGTLAKGTQKQWIADESVRVRSGNAGAVYITINNQQPHRLGEPGAVEEFTYQAKADNNKPKTQASS